MSHLSNFRSSTPVFIPNLLKPPVKPTTFLPACPTRHPRHTSAYIPSPPLSTSRRVPNAVLSRNAPPLNLQIVPKPPVFPHPQQVTFPLLDPNINATHLIPPSPSSQHARRPGRRHSEEARRKIGEANRGNVPWNKGRPHSEETRRKIAENTRRAMLRPEMRQKLQARARGRKHSEATKLKIRQTSRLVRGAGCLIKRRQKKRPVPFVFHPDAVQQINQNVTMQIEASFAREDAASSSKYLAQGKRIMSEQTKAKLSRRIKEMWDDPDYRTRVAMGVKERNTRLLSEKSVASSEQGQDGENSFPNFDPSDIDPASSSASSLVDTCEEKKKTTKKRARVRKPKVIPTTLYEDILREEEPYSGKSIVPRDIVLDVNELQGWTKEDLGIVGMHGAGRIDRGTLQFGDEPVSPIPTTIDPVAAVLVQQHVSLEEHDVPQESGSIVSEKHDLASALDVVDAVDVGSLATVNGSVQLDSQEESVADVSSKEPFSLSSGPGPLLIPDMEISRLGIAENAVLSCEPVTAVSCLETVTFNGDEEVGSNPFSQEERPNDIMSPLGATSFDFGPSDEIVFDDDNADDEKRKSLASYVDEDFNLLEPL